MIKNEPDGYDPLMRRFKITIEVNDKSAVKPEPEVQIGSNLMI